MSNEDIKTQVEATLKAEFAEYHEHQGCGDECSAKFTEAQHIESATTQILSLVNEARVEELERVHDKIMPQGLSSRPMDYVGAWSENLNFISDRIKELKEEK